MAYYVHVTNVKLVGMEAPFPRRAMTRITMMMMGMIMMTTTTRSLCFKCKIELCRLGCLVCSVGAVDSLRQHLDTEFIFG